MGQWVPQFKIANQALLILVAPNMMGAMSTLS
jgi:hypothetical protein